MGAHRRDPVLRPLPEVNRKWIRTNLKSPVIARGRLKEWTTPAVVATADEW